MISNNAGVVFGKIFIVATKQLTYKEKLQKVAHIELKIIKKY